MSKKWGALLSLIFMMMLYCVFLMCNKAEAPLLFRVKNVMANEQDDYLLQDVEGQQLSVYNENKAVFSNHIVSMESSLLSVSKNFFSHTTVHMIQGRKLFPSDFNSNCVLLEKDQAVQLFGHTEVLDQSVTIGAESYVVVGVYRAQRDVFSKLVFLKQAPAYIPLKEGEEVAYMRILDDTYSPANNAFVKRVVHQSVEVLEEQDVKNKQKEVKMLITCFMLFLSVLQAKYLFVLFQRKNLKNIEKIRYNKQKYYRKEFVQRSFVPLLSYLILLLPIFYVLFFTLLFVESFYINPYFLPSNASMQSIGESIVGKIMSENQTRDMVAQSVNILRWMQKAAMALFVVCLYTIHRAKKGGAKDEKKN